ncbi:L,D-transpeptidase family protein [Alsobacter sp. R-9]
MIAPSRLLYVRVDPLDHRRGRIGIGHRTYPCALGRSGATRRKREGDGATPLGVLRPLGVFWRRDRVTRPLCLLPRRPIQANDGWCDDVNHPRYNRPVRLPFPASHETMRRADHLYDVVIDLDWNRRPAIRGRGSAIFLHLARAGYAPTEGCIAVSAKTMRLLLPLLTPATRLVVTR